jgi:hypothetical protein
MPDPNRTSFAARLAALPSSSLLARRRSRQVKVQ